MVLQNMVPVWQVTLHHILRFGSEDGNSQFPETSVSLVLHNVLLHRIAVLFGCDTLFTPHFGEDIRGYLLLKIIRGKPLRTSTMKITNKMHYID